MTRLLTYPDLRPRGITYTRVHINRLEQDGRFPRRVRLGENRVAWVEDEIEGWLQDRIAERDREAADA